MSDDDSGDQGTEPTDVCNPVAKATVEQHDDVCANCGKSSSDGCKLKNCTACRLVKYCSVDCQKRHRKSHKNECKKRAQELKDERLFGTGLEFFLGDCPVCLVPMPIDAKDRCFAPCCMKSLCLGCELAAYCAGSEIGSNICPFCRNNNRVPSEISLAAMQSRIDSGDAEAFDKMGSYFHLGREGLPKDDVRAVELWTEAAQLGSINAHASLADVYGSHMGSYGVKKDQKICRYHWEQAAMGGHHIARNGLGCDELEKGRYDCAVRHFMIAAKMGFDLSLKSIGDMFRAGQATKEDYTEALRGYQDAVKERSSPDRDRAEDYRRQLNVPQLGIDPNSLQYVPPRSL